MNLAPDINNSSIEERREYIKNRFPCIADYVLSFVARMQNWHTKII